MQRRPVAEDRIHVQIRVLHEAREGIEIDLVRVIKGVVPEEVRTPDSAHHVRLARPLHVTFYIGNLGVVPLSAPGFFYSQVGLHDLLLLAHLAVHGIRRIPRVELMHRIFIHDDDIVGQAGDGLGEVFHLFGFVKEIAQDQFLVVLFHHVIHELGDNIDTLRRRQLRQNFRVAEDFVIALVQREHDRCVCIWHRRYGDRDQRQPIRDQLRFDAVEQLDWPKAVERRGTIQQLVDDFGIGKGEAAAIALAGP